MVHFRALLFPRKLPYFRPFYMARIIESASYFFHYFQPFRGNENNKPIPKKIKIEVEFIETSAEEIVGESVTPRHRNKEKFVRQFSVKEVEYKNIKKHFITKLDSGAQNVNDFLLKEMNV